MIRRVVVTGAFGYLGLALVRRLAASRQVIAIGHPPRAAVTLPPSIETVEGDLTLAARYLDPDTALVHLAGGGGDARCREDPVAAVDTLARGTSVLAAAAREAGAATRVLASSIFVYGTQREHGTPYSERDEIAPDDLYGALKAAAEHVWTAHGGGTALRIANIYGAGAGIDVGLQGAIERFARAAAAGGEITIYGEGRQRIDYVHVDDVCRAIELAIDATDLPAVINIGGGAPVAIAELADTCARAGDALGAAPRIVRVPAPAGKVWPDRSLSIELASTALGWAPATPLERGVAELVAMMKGSR